MTLNLIAGFDTLNLHPPLEVMHLPAGDVWIQRDDLIHPVISGNKWRKLVGHLAEMSAQGKRILVTYGGAYSNHLVATAVAAELSGVRCIGILRGDEPLDNHYLRVARNAGMEVIGVSRSLYRDKLASLSWVLQSLGIEEDAVYVVQEGGKGEHGFVGFEAVVAAWLNHSLKLEHVFHASATATTAIGLRRAMDHVRMNAVIHAVMVLKNVEEQQQFAHEQGASERLEFVSGYEFGGYAKSDAVLASFMEVVRTQNDGIPIDFVYTGKALFALNEWLLSGIDSGVLRSDAAGVYPVVFLHTGGVLQMNG
ncbi:MAG: pyridoxal-phosphate dependent enzyme [Bacteroidia bacterium]|nr:pyridoxal-phosphate dependent enzyme [Bacteroidia bacterium]